MSAHILERAAACVWQASRRLLAGYRLTEAIDPFAYRTLAGATACGTPALERMAKGTLRLAREAELEMALARHIDGLARATRMDEPQALLGVRRRRTLSEILPARLPTRLPKSYGGQDFGGLPSDTEPDGPPPEGSGPQGEAA